MLGRVTRTLTGFLAWLGAVVVATVVGLMAVNAIGSGLVGPGQQVLDPAEVDARLAASGPEPTVAPTSASAPPPAAPTVIPSDGGTVVARCVDGGLEIISTSPAQGWEIHDEAEEDLGRVRFENGRDRVELRMSCVDGQPRAEIRNG